MHLSEKIKTLSAVPNKNYYADRICSELQYLYRISAVKGGEYDGHLNPVLDRLLAVLQEEGTVGKRDCLAAEEALTTLSGEAKRYTALCIGHAHMDMNWMWGYEETVALVVETVRTMLTMLEEYPEFTFAQSQASVYRILEEFAPEYLAKIRKYIAEGRWEVSASTWVEGDKNMANGESLVRHALYTKRYLSDLLGVDPATLNLDFEPDTFGHSENIPTLENAVGVNYYYHCRGCDIRGAYIWRGKDGSELLTWQEPKWYLGAIESSLFADYPSFCSKVCHGGIDFFPVVYGVGDHGGGATRRDLNRILDMREWPLFPTIRFSTFREFYQKLETVRAKLPVYTGEINFVFNGCYTTQSRVKMANRKSEEKLGDAEALTVGAMMLAGADAKLPSFRTAWEKALFAQFHDILPGSCMRESREYAMGEFQKIMAHANRNAIDAMRAVADRIDTSAILTDTDPEGIAEGGATSYQIDINNSYAFSTQENGRGKVRIFHLYNPAPYAAHKTFTLSVFDYPYDMENTALFTADGERVPFTVLSRNKWAYYLHTVNEIMADVSLPAFGYTTLVLRPVEEMKFASQEAFTKRSDPRCDHWSDVPYVLENSKLKAAFSHRNFELISLIDKASGKEMISPDKPSGFLTYMEESNSRSMSAWTVGPILREVNLNETCDTELVAQIDSGLCRKIAYKMHYLSSDYTVTVSLSGEEDVLNFDILADWHEVGKANTFVPALSFSVPVGYTVPHYRYDVPAGRIVRDPRAYDVPALSYMELLAETENAPHLMIVTDNKYGYRGFENAGRVALLRSAYYPDSLPEAGEARTNIGLSVVSSAEEAEERACIYNHPFTFLAAGLSHTGELPASGAWLICKGGACVSALKPAEDGGIVIRLNEKEGKESISKLTFPKKIGKAVLCDGCENEVSALAVKGDTVSVPVTPFSVVTVKAFFRD